MFYHTTEGADVVGVCLYGTSATTIVVIIITVIPFTTAEPFATRLSYHVGHENVIVIVIIIISVDDDGPRRIILFPQQEQDNRQ